MGPNTDFGQVSGTLAISNSQGGRTPGLTGIAAANSGSGTLGFTSMAAPNGSYNLVIPLGNSSISYNSVTISAFVSRVRFILGALDGQPIQYEPK